MFKHRNEEERRAVLELGRLGHSSIEVAKRVGVSAPTAWRWMSEAGLCRRRRGQHGPKFDHLMVAPLERDLAWLACFLDCEGSLSLTARNRKRTYLPAIRIGNTNRAIIDRGILLLQVYGVAAGIALTRRKSCVLTANPKPVFNIYASNLSVARLLPWLLPHLIIKREFAGALIGMFCERTIGRIWDDADRALAEFVRYRFMPRSRRGEPPSKPPGYDLMIQRVRLAPRASVQTSPRTPAAPPA